MGCALGIIKLDRALISEITPASPHPEWLDGVSAMLRSSTLSVIAEGVETELQCTTLRAAGIQEAQGYFFSRSLPAAAFMNYYGETRNHT